MVNHNIIIYSNQIDYYSTTLKGKLDQIRNINETNKEFLSGNWDSNVKYKSSFDKNLMELQPKHYQERGKWVDFIFITKNIKTEVITFTIEGLVHGKMRLILLLFWKNIASKLGNNTNFKLQLKLNFSIPLVSEDKTETAYSKDITYHTVVRNTPTIRSIGSVNIYNTNNFYEALSYFEYHLTEHADQYYVFHVTNIILTYNICPEDSILNKIDTTKRNFNLLVKKRKKVRYFTNLPKCKALSENFITMDLETKNIDDILVPYCVSIFNGKKSYSFYISDYSSSEDMLKASIKFILKRKYNKHRVYLHNISYFDGIFLMRAISSIVNSNYIKPIIRDGRIINLKVEFYSKNKNKKIKYYLEFRDSYLLLTSSLEKLGNTFSINKGKLEQKLSFPYRFVNEPWVDYNYVGSVPEFKYYDKISENEYNQLVKSKSSNINKWDLKKETIKYCEQDCKTLYYSILQFSKLIYLQFRVDI